MEIGFDTSIPTYSGGLGVLAGDTIRAAADLKVPIVAVTLVHRKGYFYQHLDSAGHQSEEPVEWSLSDYLAEMPQRAAVTIEGRNVQIRAWKYQIKGLTDYAVPIYFLDTDLDDNDPYDRRLTDTLYGGDLRYRLCQETVLGIGGIRILRALGYHNLTRYHMNEGHAALLTLELLDERRNLNPDASLGPHDIDAVRKQCVFTTHTPVPAGHDQFPLSLAQQIIGPHPVFQDKQLCCSNGDAFNMTHLALNLSHYINGVAKRHGEISRHMFNHYVIDSITNGIYPASWSARSFQALFDEFIPGWRTDNFSLRYALNLPKDRVWNAHTQAKQRLLQYVNRETNAGMDLEFFTIGFARRSTAYKRADLVFDDLERLRQLARNLGPLQFVYAGKAHPNDDNGKALIKKVFDARDQLKPDVKVAYLANYDIDIGQLMTAGVDVWLNTPEPPMEASGTSGMKAALNGVPSLSVLDGWWIEGCIEGITGWAIGEDSHEIGQQRNRQADAASLYDKLEQKVVPLFYNQRDAFINIMAHAIALNGSFFNTQRMIQQYVLKAYFH